MTTTTMSQSAPYPDALADLVGRLEYRPEWSFELVDEDRGQGSSGLTLVIAVDAVDSYHHDRRRRVHHLMPVPPASYTERDWRRWLLEQCLLVERHEACEFFTVDGVKPYAPDHAPGHDPYTVVELTTDEDRRTNFRGELGG